MNNTHCRLLGPVILLALSWCWLSAVSMQYDITSLGLHVADLRIVRDPGTRNIQVYVTSRTASAIFPKLNNQYRVHYDVQYRPVEYKRVVDQGKTQDKVAVSYDHASGKASATHSGPLGKYNYSLRKGERDFFSTLALICDTAPGSGTYILDANGKAWSAAVSYKGTSNLKTALGTYACREYTLVLNPVDSGKVPYVDMVTHNLFKKNNKVSLWIASDGTAIKAVVKMGVLSMKWSISGISK